MGNGRNWGKKLMQNVVGYIAPYGINFDQPPKNVHSVSKLLLF